MSIRATTFVASLQPASSHGQQRHTCCQQKRQHQQKSRKPGCCRGSHAGLQKDEGQVCVVLDFPVGQRKPAQVGKESPN